MTDKRWLASPVLGVRRVRQAAEYYRDVLGFDLDPVDGVFQPSPDEPDGVYAIIKRPGVWIHLQIRRGARVLCVPSAFTARTGKAHWEVLLRARAIENLAYVLAPAQAGEHGGGRSSHGQAMIVDPWGVVVAQVPEGEGVALAEIDTERVERVRRELPALAHARLPPLARP